MSADAQPYLSPEFQARAIAERALAQVGLLEKRVRLTEVAASTGLRRYGGIFFC